MGARKKPFCFCKTDWDGFANRLQITAKLALLNAGQHGSVPNCTTMDPIIMLTALTNDLCRILKLNIARLGNTTK